MDVMYSADNDYDTVEPKPSRTVSTEHLAAEVQWGTSTQKIETIFWKIVIIMTAVFAFVALILAGISHQAFENRSKAVASPKQDPALPSSANSVNSPRSCRDIKGKSGMYQIQPDSYLPAYFTYCDMATNGGGWTLVAAVHENNIKGKCTKGDLWSSDQGYGYSRNTYNGTGNWENINTFGDARNLLNGDYKNSAYFNVKASDVLIWHVPNNATLSTMSSKAFLKYYTTDGVLQRHGGTLRTLYRDSAPLSHAGSYRFHTLIASPITYTVGDNDKVMSAIPTRLIPYVTPGMLQFRAFDPYGYPNALCPGVQITRGDSTRVCIGGGVTGSSRTCGDFLGWDGTSGRYISPPTMNNPSITGRPLYYVDSSIFIFTR
uniref:Intelectin-1b-like n=1 Tax=Ciona intestinalis TaxID=7719 RepID=F6XRZ3_CIOIN|nr:intelectin-1b-like [Ciona intestinalis]|eukprot:XP_002121647.1 intelectin-1b-like [Ciona intestinalis]